MFKATKKDQEKTKNLIVQYFEQHAEDILLAVQVIDAASFLDIADRWEGRGEVPFEIELWEFLNDMGLDVVLAANKMDRIAKVDLDPGTGPDLRAAGHASSLDTVDGQDRTHKRKTRPDRAASKHYLKKEGWETAIAKAWAQEVCPAPRTPSSPPHVCRSLSPWPHSSPERHFQP